MMQAMRNPKVLKWGLYFILAVAIPAFVFIGPTLGDPNAANTADDLEYVRYRSAEGRETIGRTDMFVARNQLVQDYSRTLQLFTGQFPNQLMMNNLDKGVKLQEVAEFAIGQEGMKELATESDMIVGNQEFVQFLRDSGYTSELLRQNAASQGMNVLQFEQLQKDFLLQSKGEQILRVAARSSLFESWLNYKMTQDVLSGRYVQIPVSALQADLEITEDEMVAYYEDNLDQYIKQEERVYRYTMMDPPPIPPSPVVDADEIQAEYDAAVIAGDEQLAEPVGKIIRHIELRVDDNDTTETIRQQLEELNASELTSEQFGEFADLLSEDSANFEFSGTSVRKVGGLLSEKFNDESRDMFIEEYGDNWAAAVEALEANQVSEPIESNESVYLIRADGLSSGFISLEEATPIIRTRIQTRKNTERQEALAARNQIINEDEQRFKEIVASRTTLDSIASAINSDVRETSPTISTRSFIMPIGSLERSRVVLEDLQLNEVSPVLRTDGSNNLVVLEIKEILPERNRTLDEVRPAVEAAVRNQKAVELARSMAEEIAAAARGAEDGLDTAMDAYLTENTDSNLEVKDTVTDFTREDPPSDFLNIPTLPNKTFRMQIGDVVTLEKGFGDNPSEIIVFELTNKQEPDRREFLASIGTMDRDLTVAKGEAFILGYREDALNKLEPDFNERLLTETSETDRRSRRRRQ